MPVVELAVASTALSPHDKRNDFPQFRHTDNTRWRSIAADLTFWTVAGAVVAAFGGPLGAWWNVPRSALLVGGLAFLVFGVALLFGLNRIRPTSRGLVLAFGVSNLLLAPTLGGGIARRASAERGGQLGAGRRR